MSKAKFKYNSGYGALCCSQCSRIIKEGTQFTDEERLAAKGELKLPAQYCDSCKEKRERNKSPKH